MPQHSNRLIHETSPYLLQHAHNPVDWYPWCDEAFERAKVEDKPVLVSIGYAACHWCHVMERESFEKEDVAAIMNEHFINIKVDREERPDVDHIYMDAVQAISGSGGWPLNVFLTPDRKPFYGGTYFPPQRAFNRASWTEVLLSLSQAYKNQKDEVLKQADSLTDHLQASNAFGLSVTDPAGLFTQNRIDEAFKNIMSQADRQWGGFGRAPKFPQTFTISFLLRYAHLQENEEARQQALLSLDKMMQGGIYDHIGGGFARYSTDTEWFVPHFEKMLYDNALLVSTLAEAYQLTGDDRYKEVIDEILQFVEREMLHAEGGFYSALDADSEGEEGKFYVWTEEEIKDALGDEAEVFCAYFDISAKGNWEGKNILWVKVPLRQFAHEREMDPVLLLSFINRSKKVLLERRNKRIRPQLDDKILLGWNALMTSAYCKAFAATGNDHYLSVAQRNTEFLLKVFNGENGLMYHTWKNGEARYPAFLDDYSYLIAALLELAQSSGNHKYIYKAKELAETVISHFSDDPASLFYYTSKDQEDVPVRKKEVYDGATPSGNAVMAINLYKLSIIFDLPEWKEQAIAMVSSVGSVTIKYPTSFGVWLSGIEELVRGTNEIAIVGKDWKMMLKKVLEKFIPHKIIMGSETGQSQHPLLKDKGIEGETLIYLCRNYACLKPVNTVLELYQQILANYLQKVQ